MRKDIHREHQFTNFDQSHIILNDFRQMYRINRITLIRFLDVEFWFKNRLKSLRLQLFVVCFLISS